MKIIRPTVHPFLQEFKRLPRPKTGECLTNLRGSFSAQVLLLCEHPTELELANNAPFTDTAAVMYCSIINSAGFSHEDNFLIVPYSRFGKKPSKASTVDTLPFLQRHMPEHIRCVVCVGMSAFGFVFAGGRKTHAQTILGNPMYIPRLRTLPVYVLPDSSLLLDATSEDYRMRNKAVEKGQFIYDLTLNLKKFLTEKLEIKL